MKISNKLLHEKTKNAIPHELSNFGSGDQGAEITKVTKKTKLQNDQYFNDQFTHIVQEIKVLKCPMLLITQSTVLKCYLTTEKKLTACLHLMRILVINFMQLKFRAKPM